MPGKERSDATPMDPAMTIGVFSRRTRLSSKALRLFDSNGLLVPAEVDSVSGYRLYRESQLDRARMIGLLRRIDVPLAKVAEILAVSPAEGANLLSEYWNDVQEALSARFALAAHLHRRMLGEERETRMFEIRERYVPAQFVITKRSHVTSAELPAWIGSSIQSLIAASQALGGPKSAPVVIYHGAVSEDSDGPVEACLEIDASHEGTEGLAARWEPAHRQAYATIPKSQVLFPQILTAYDAVERWIRDNGKTTVGPPREVNFGDWMSAGPDDLVVDVAFPISN